MITERSMNIIVTAGGTSEPIDNVRRIANTGTGRLGSLVADELAEADWTGHIFYVCAKDSIRPVSKRVTCVEIQSVADLQEAVTELTEKYVIHGVVHSMAVSDYKVRSVSTIDSLSEYLEKRSAETGDLQKKIVQGMDETDLREGVGKLSSQMGAPLLLLEPTPKILPMFREMAPQAVIIGFKLLSQVSVEELFDTAHRLLVKNRCDFVLANDMTEIDENHHRGYLIDPERNIQTFDTKQEIAKGIVQTIYSEVEHR